MHTMRGSSSGNLKEAHRFKCLKPETDVAPRWSVALQMRKEMPSIVQYANSTGWSLGLNQGGWLDCQGLAEGKAWCTTTCWCCCPAIPAAAPEMLYAGALQQGTFVHPRCSSPMPGLLPQPPSSPIWSTKT